MAASRRTAGAQGVILGCTELPLRMSQDDASVPLFHTTLIHCEQAMAHACGHG
jgi:aspartate racemase